MSVFRRHEPKEVNPAGQDATELAARVVPLLSRATGESWYKRYDNEVDAAVVGLCRLRRAAAGQRGGPEAGDDAVRAALDEAGPEAAAWIASRAISYMDEQGYPETMAPWLGDLEELDLDQ
jgi:hypothetical protein